MPKPKNGKPRIQICKEINETQVGKFVLMNNVVYLVFRDNQSFKKKEKDPIYHLAVSNG